jgi:hypothetical protein
VSDAVKEALAELWLRFAPKWAPRAVAPDDDLPWDYHAEPGGLVPSARAMNDLLDRLRHGPGEGE